MNIIFPLIILQVKAHDKSVGFRSLANATDTNQDNPFANVLNYHQAHTEYF
jgi:hypothetical protein